MKYFEFGQENEKIKPDFLKRTVSDVIAGLMGAVFKMSMQDMRRN